MRDRAKDSFIREVASLDRRAMELEKEMRALLAVISDSEVWEKAGNDPEEWARPSDSPEWYGPLEQARLTLAHLGHALLDEQERLRDEAEREGGDSPLAGRDLISINQISSLIRKHEGWQRDYERYREQRGHA